MERVQRERPAADARDDRRARVLHALRRDARGRASMRRRAHGVGLHVHAAEDARRRGATRKRGPRRRASQRGSRGAGALDERTLLAHGVHLDDERDRARPRGRRVARPQRPLQHEQRASAARGSTPSARASRSAPTGSAPTCSRSRGRRSSASARTASAAGPELAARRASPKARASSGGAFGEPRLGNARDGRSRRPRRPRLRGAGAAPRVELRRTLDLRPLLPLRPRRHGRGRVGRPRPAARRASTSRSWRPRARARRPSGSGSASRRSAPTRSSRKEAGDGRRHWRPRSALPAGQAPDPRRHALRAARRGSAASRPSGRPRAGSSARRPSRWPRSPPSRSGSRSARAS